MSKEFKPFHKTKLCIIRKSTDKVLEIELPTEMSKLDPSKETTNTIMLNLQHIISDYELEGYLQKKDEFIDIHVTLIAKFAHAKGLDLMSHIYFDHNKWVHVKGSKYKENS